MLQESGILHAVVAFCEVENRKVLEDLIYNTYLSKFNYRIIHEESPDRRGIDVCLIYRNSDVDDYFTTGTGFRQKLIEMISIQEVFFMQNL